MAILIVAQLLANAKHQLGSAFCSLVAMRSTVLARRWRDFTRVNSASFDCKAISTAIQAGYVYLLSLCLTEQAVEFQD